LLLRFPQNINNTSYGSLGYIYSIQPDISEVVWCLRKQDLRFGFIRRFWFWRAKSDFL